VDVDRFAVRLILVCRDFTVDKSIAEFTAKGNMFGSVGHAVGFESEPVDLGRAPSRNFKIISRQAE